MGAQLAPLDAVFDAFGNQLEAERTAEADHRADDGARLLVFVDAVGEDAVDLQHLDRQALELCQRGVAGPEVIHRDVEAEFVQPAQHAQVGLHVGHQRGLGDFEEGDPARIDAGFGERCREIIGEALFGKLARRDVDRHVGRVGAPAFAHGGNADFHFRHAKRIERMSDGQLFVERESDTGGLLAVAQCGVVDDDLGRKGRTGIHAGQTASSAPRIKSKRISRLVFSWRKCDRQTMRWRTIDMSVPRPNNPPFTTSPRGEHR